MNVWDFANRHPIVTLFMADAIFANACRLVNNIAICRTAVKGGAVAYEEAIETSTEEVSDEKDDTVKAEA